MFGSVPKGRRLVEYVSILNSQMIDLIELQALRSWAVMEFCSSGDAVQTR